MPYAASGPRRPGASSPSQNASAGVTGLLGGLSLPDAARGFTVAEDLAEVVAHSAALICGA
jgi:hypothetical protein